MYHSAWPLPGGAFYRALSMANYSTSEFKSGLRIIIDGNPCIIVENEFVKPGKGQAFNRVKIRNLKTGRVLEKTFRSGESVEAADVIDRDLQYLYSDGEFWHFMDNDSFEQYQADATAMGDAVNKAFRLEAATKEIGHEIVISRSTYALMRIPDEVLPLFTTHTVDLKGYDEPEAVHALGLAGLVRVAGALGS